MKIIIEIDDLQKFDILEALANHIGVEYPNAKISEEEIITSFVTKTISEIAVWHIDRKATMTALALNEEKKVSLKKADWLIKSEISTYKEIL